MGGHRPGARNHPGPAAGSQDRRQGRGGSAENEELLPQRIHILHRVLERAGLPKIRFHDLRHTFATVALQNGVDIKTVSGMLGHYSAGFTLDTYAHVTTAAQREAAKIMGNILSAVRKD